MSEYTIQLPSKPQIIKEEKNTGLYQIDGLYPGYGHTLGNSLRRIILSSLPGAAITGVKIEGISHEFGTIEGVKEDVIMILLNLKKIRIKLATEEQQILTIKATGPNKVITAGDIEIPGQVEVLNPDQHIATVTGKVTLNAELRVEKGLGYVPKEVVQNDRVEVGEIALDAIFTPVRRVNYEVENMRVGDRTDFNRLKLFIETDGTITPKEILEESISTMITQLKAIVGFKEEEEELDEIEVEQPVAVDEGPDVVAEQEEELQEFLKTRIESLSLSTRTENALDTAGIRTVGGLVRKKEDDILNIEGLGDKGLQEIKRVLGNHGIILTEEI